MKKSYSNHVDKLAKLFRDLCVPVLLLLTASQFVIAQDRGFQPGASYALSDIEAINSNNGNAIVRVPLAKLPAGRGGVPGPQLNLVYNSKLLESHTEVIPEQGTGRLTTQIFLGDSSLGGWRYEFQQTYSLNLVSRANTEGEYPCACGSDFGKNAYIWKLRVIFPDGGEHEFRPLGYDDPYKDGFFNINPNGLFESVGCLPEGACSHGTVQGTTSGMTYYTTDGTFLRLFVPYSSSGAWGANWTLSFPDGRRLVNVNGNQTMYDHNNNVLQSLADSLGRQITLTGGDDEDRISIIGANNQKLEWVVKWKNVFVNRQYNTTQPPGREKGNGSLQTLNLEMRVVDRITLPAQAGGLSYVFGYSASNADPYPGFSPGWGELNAITLPTGARVNYTWNFDDSNSGSNPLLTRPDWDWVLTNHVVRKDLTYLQQNDNTSTSVTETTTYSGNGVPVFKGGLIVTAPDGSVTSSSSFAQDSNLKFAGLSRKSIQADGTMIEQAWAENRPAGIAEQPKAINPFVQAEFTSIKNANGDYVKTAIKNFSYDKNGNVTRIDEYDWIDSANVERDTLGVPKPLSQWQWQGYGAFLKRSTTSRYYAATPDASDTFTSSSNVYISLSAPLLRSAVKDTEVSLGTQKFARTEYFYDDPLTTGNPTQQKSWDSTKGAYSSPLEASNSISNSTEYNQYGSPVATTDARQVRTELVYGLVGNAFDLYPTEVKTAVGTTIQRTEKREYDFNVGVVTKVTDADNNVSTVASFDDLGRPILVRAAASLPEETQTSTQYFDAQRRVVVRSDLVSVGDGKLVTIQHYDQLGRVRLSRRLEEYSPGTPIDPLVDETAGIKVQTRYIVSNPCQPTNAAQCLSDNQAVLGSYVLNSNPYRAATSSVASSESTMGWTRTRSDRTGRTVETQTFAGASLPAPWGSNSSSTGTVATVYDATSITVTDQAGKARKSVSDALGRLTDVYEDPAVLKYQTTYTYNSLDDLIKVNQGGQERFFMYSSLKRLIRAKNPEQDVFPGLNLFDPLTSRSGWSEGYEYYPDGSLSKKTDARGVTTEPIYDALNRVTKILYRVNGQPDPNTGDIEYLYDNAANGKGRLWLSFRWGQKPAQTAVGSYDALGRVTQLWQLFGNGQGGWSAGYEINRNYNRAGAVTSQTYPSRHAVSYDYDGAGRTSGLNGNLGDGINRAYATAITYSPFGGMQKEEFGTTQKLNHNLAYNRRGQPFYIALGANDGDYGKLIYYYGSEFTFGGSGPDNNGNISLIDNHIPGGPLVHDHYEYDRLNRLDYIFEEKTVGATTTSSFRQKYDYDRWGNRTINPNSNETWGINKIDFVKEDTTNRLYAPGDLQLAETDPARRIRYDAAGNQIKDTYTGYGTAVFDAENHIAAIQDRFGGSSRYTHNAAGQRVRRNISNQETWQIYGIDGELVSEYAANAAITSPQKEYGYRNGELLIAATSGSAGWGPAPGYTSANPLVTGTGIKLEDLTELRAAVNQLRQRVGLPAFNFTVDPDPARTVTTVKADHIRQLRSALEPARTALQLPTGGYAHPTLINQTTFVYAIDFQELRAQIAEAWQRGSGTVDVRWLVTDHLGTPRMTVNQTGSFSSITRHDYLPFGEELFAETGGRKSQMGYVDSDNIRQKFTAYERDTETQLDFAEARYYSNTQGRYTRPDPYNIVVEMNAGRNAQERIRILGAYLSEPKNWNRYSYVLNDPLNLIDPSGLIWLTKDDRSYTWIETPEYEKNREAYKDYSVANGAVIQYQGSSGCPECRDLKKGDWIQLDQNGHINQVSDPTMTVFDEHDDERAMIGIGTMQSWVTFRSSLPDFRPAYVNGEIDLPSPFGVTGPAVTGSLDRNGNVFIGSGVWVGSPGASASAGWMLPNEPAENIESFLSGSSDGVTGILPCYVGGGVTRSSGRYSPQVSLGTPGITASRTYSRKAGKIKSLSW